jgi:phage tail sheath protein FI
MIWWQSGGDRAGGAQPWGQSGRLGPRRGARYRTYELLQDYLRHRQGDLFLTDSLRAAVQAIYDHPLTTEAVDKLNRQLRTEISSDALAEMVTNMHRDDPPRGGEPP